MDRVHHLRISENSDVITVFLRNFYKRGLKLGMVLGVSFRDLLLFSDIY